MFIVSTSKTIQKKTYNAIFRTTSPLHTQAKSCDHGIMRAKKVSKGHPKTLSKPCNVVMGPQV